MNEPIGHLACGCMRAAVDRDYLKSMLLDPPDRGASHLVAAENYNSLMHAACSYSVQTARTV
ncbi:hypothetical protein JQ615_38110 [Bradyrhizobium jicamae]|uniref:Uncharacterized protein n=1 Tax=Bradyrhizobium jicamae TaxID=280332 RepID=A0ABS5FWE5_9BRAD|nr:hypothetical protein [Bradyrhizobium jicamae]